jgi:hypothetical protein
MYNKVSNVEYLIGNIRLFSFCPPANMNADKPHFVETVNIDNLDFEICWQ